MLRRIPARRPRIADALIGLREEEAPRRVSRLRGDGGLEVPGRGLGAPLFQQNPSEKTSRLGQIALERHGLLGVASCVRQAIVLLVHPRQVDVSGAVTVRSHQRVRERPPRAIAIAERQAADAHVDRELRQRRRSTPRPSRRLPAPSGADRRAAARALEADATTAGPRASSPSRSAIVSARGSPRRE